MVRPLEILGPESLTVADTKTEALAKLAALAENVDEALAARKASGLIRRAIKSWNIGRAAHAGQLALEATRLNPENPYGYLVLAIALEKMNYLYKSLVTYEEALKRAPDDPEIIINLGGLASKLSQKDTAEKLFRKYIDLRPESPLGYNNLACLLSERNHVDEAIDLVREAIFRLPEEAVLWNCLATILAEEGRVAESVTFYQEAIRLSPTSTRFYHNLGFAYMHLNRIPEAIQLYEDALEHVVDTSERLESRYSHSICLIQDGQVEKGFQEYEVRNHKRFRGYTEYMLKVPQWQGEPLQGRRILLVGEQGLGDEIMFANIIPDLCQAVGPEGKVYIAVEPRLVPIFTRSFPNTLVGKHDDRTLLDKDGNQQLRFFPHIENEPTPDYYAPFGSAISYIRKTVEDFPHKAFLIPDTARRDTFLQYLRADGFSGPLIGICWRSMMMNHKRSKYYSRLEDWGALFAIPDVRFVNLQYGICEEELMAAEQMFGINICQPCNPDGTPHDLTQDIDGNVSLSAALDLVISAPTSVGATSAAVGTETWFLLSSNGWPQMGRNEYPWYPRTRTFISTDFGNWPTAVRDMADELKTRLQHPTQG